MCGSKLPRVQEVMSACYISNIACIYRIWGVLDGQIAPIIQSYRTCHVMVNGDPNDCMNWLRRFPFSGHWFRICFHRSYDGTQNGCKDIARNHNTSRANIQWKYRYMQYLRQSSHPDFARHKHRYTMSCISSNFIPNKKSPLYLISMA